MTADYLEIDYGGQIAVRAETRNKARSYIESLSGVPYTDLRVRKNTMRPCVCEGCEEIGPLKTHGYDEYWEGCSPDDPNAVEWWIG